MRNPCGDIFGIIGPLRFIQKRQTVFHQFRIPAFFDQDFTDLLCDHNRIKRIPRREKFFSVQLPCAALVPTIDTTSPPIIKDRFFDLNFDQLALFFNDDNQIVSFMVFRPTQTPANRDRAIP